MLVLRRLPHPVLLPLTGLLAAALCAITLHGATRRALAARVVDLLRGARLISSVESPPPTAPLSPVIKIEKLRTPNGLRYLRILKGRSEASGFRERTIQGDGTIVYRELGRAGKNRMVIVMTEQATGERLFELQRGKHIERYSEKSGNLESLDGASEIRDDALRLIVRLKMGNLELERYGQRKAKRTAHGRR